MEKFRDLVRTTSFGAYVLFVASVFLLLFGAGGIVALMGDYLGRIGYEVILILGAAFYWRAVAGEAAAEWPDLRRSGMGVLSFALVAAAAVVLGLWSNSVIAFLVDTFPEVFGRSAELYEQQMREFLIDSTGTQWVLAVVGVAVAAPICEEALFRGTILQEQTKSHERWVAIVLNGVLFGAFHFIPLVVLPLAVVGAYLAHVGLRSGSLWPPILGHFALNAFNGVVLPYLTSGGGEAEASAVARLLAGRGATAGEYALTLGGLGALAALLWWAAIVTLEGGEEDQAME